MPVYEGTKFDKKRRSEYAFRRRKGDRNDPLVLTKLTKVKKAQTCSRYFLNNVQPHKSYYLQMVVERVNIMIPICTSKELL